ncbi:uncharacterized protein H6S33_005125 [Morchella sextelata]|uniref:uncharacterized protein n=1 Tax=Morchella sextelata TaxID=1174677 RepID=UPI001D049632|nr:uncharacterized protein H6S33_005125 [Morchella sextelata]KAH0605143.1 hypothetical protein H6S33_005125 [Morchella sextelata]
MNLSAFPHLTSTEFTAACTALHASLPPATCTLTHHPTTLTFHRPLPTNSSTPDTSTPSTPTTPTTPEPPDPESLPPPPAPAPGPTITYQLQHSPTYNVPVLYFQPHTPHPLSLAAIYERIVPTSSAEALRRVGVLGAVSQADNPADGEVWWFVHPCSTAEAMGELRGLWGDGVGMGAEEWYVRVWVGLVGGVVGLRLEGVGLETGRGAGTGTGTGVEAEAEGV